jgi:hypothetical protein
MLSFVGSSIEIFILVDNKIDDLFGTGERESSIGGTRGCGS